MAEIAFVRMAVVVIVDVVSVMDMVLKGMVVMVAVVDMVVVMIAAVDMVMTIAMACSRSGGSGLGCGGHGSDGCSSDSGGGAHGLYRAYYDGRGSDCVDKIRDA